MVIAFCTSCMNRRWQLETTLAHNLDVLAGTPHFLALCNYNSNDQLDEYVRGHHLIDQRRESLLYFRTLAPSLFDASKAKNLAHRLALTRQPDVLFNLDADNFITAETLETVTEVFSSPDAPYLHHWSQTWRDGSFGRIALRAADWMRLGGYDEALTRMGWQDMDLLNRARAIGLQYRLVSTGIKPAVPNDFAQKLANAGLDFNGDDGAQRKFKRLTHENMLVAFSRPVVLDVAEQARYAGVLNFGTDAVI